LPTQKSEVLPAAFANSGSQKKAAVNAATAILAVLLPFGTGPGGAVPQEQDNQSQPIDQVELNKNTGTVQKVER
jgi:hypothetical protein